ncbi:MAG: hypothetical protein ACXVZJ_00430 [Terriglobales bacterium]
MKTSRGKHRRGERGVALLMALFALLILAAVGLGMMYSANTETAINSNYGGSMRAYYAALGGIEEARDRVRTNTTNGITPPARTPSSAGHTIYLVNPYVNSAGNTITPKPWLASDSFIDDEYCHEFPSTDPGLGTPCTVLPYDSSTNTNWYGYYSGGSSTYTGTTWHSGGSSFSGVPSLSPNTSTANAVDFRWTRINMKMNYSTNPVCVNGSGITCSTTAQQATAVCWDGTRELLAVSAGTDCSTTPSTNNSATMPVYLLTSLAVTPNGSRRMVQMEVANNPPLVTNAAVDANNDVTVSGSSVTVNGYDNCKCACTNPPGGGAPTCTNRATGGPCTGNTYSIFASGNESESGHPATVAGTTPVVAENQSFPYDVPSLVNKYKKMQGMVDVTNSPSYSITCSAGSPYANCGSVSGIAFGTEPNPWPPTNVQSPAGVAYQYTYIPGSIDLQAHSSGAGVLVVNGNLTIHGGFEYYGLIIVAGTLTLQGSGSGQDYNVIGSIVAGQGTVADSISGGITIQYDRCALLNTNTPQPLTVVTTRELAY